MSDTDPITAAIETAVADATPEPADQETPEAASEAADVAEGSADSEDGAESAEGEKPSAKAEGEQPAEQPKRKRGPIPYDRHEAVLTKARRDAEARQTELQTRIDALARYESPEVQSQLKFLELLEKDTPRAVEILKAIDPQRFGKLSWAEQQAAAQAAAEAAAPALEKPQPDALLPDGTLGYSAEGQVKLLEWRLAQERQAYEQKVAALEAKISPVMEDRQAQAAYQQAAQRVSTVLTDARQNWPGFTENETAIREALETNPTWDLNAAYRAVVVPAFKSDRTKMEAEIERKVIEKLNARSKANTASPGGQPAATAQSENTDPDERMISVIKQQVATLR